MNAVNKSISYYPNTSPLMSPPIWKNSFKKLVTYQPGHTNRAGVETSLLLLIAEPPGPEVIGIG